MARLSPIALALALVPVACGKVKAPDEVTVDAPGADAPHIDASQNLTKPVAAITSIGIAGTQAQCTAATPSTGPGTITYVASWQIDEFPFTDTTTTAIPGDTVPGTATHTNGLVACTLFATNGTEATASDPVSVTFKPRLAYTIDRITQNLQTIDLDSFALTTIGKVDTQFEFGDIAWDAPNQILYMVNGLGDGSGSDARSLFTIDTTTAHATKVGTHGIADVLGLAFDGQERLFASAGGGPDALSLVNTTSGAFTAVGGNFSSDALAFDTKRSLMMTIESGSGQMSTLDLTTGNPTAVSNDGSVNDCGMTYDPYTDFIWVADDSGTVYRYDPKVGYARAEMKSFGGTEEMDGLAIILPPP